MNTPHEFAYKKKGSNAMTKRTTEQIEAIERLRAILKPGQTIYTDLAHVSRSGMSRAIRVIIGGKNGTVQDISYLVARAGVARFDRNHGGVIMGGGGMDMGFALVYRIGRTLYPDGVPCTGRNHTTATARVHACRSNDHINDSSMPYTRGRKHRDGGYAYRQEWL